MGLASSPAQADGFNGRRNQRKAVSQVFFGPYQIIQRVGEVAYQLQLPAGTRLHDVFHVRLLKPFKGEPPVTTSSTSSSPLPRLSSSFRGLAYSFGQGQLQVLVQWKDCSPADASWVSVEDFKSLCPDFQLTDKLLAQMGRDVMIGIPYVRKKKDKKILAKG
uniref:Tf2-1-like SH3-like domain-containing protein n=1 Tax=Arundo donax TaxID=35708 RepID=A0A0A9BBB6_ARUDO